MTVWTEITGQRDAVAELARASSISPSSAVVDDAQPPVLDPTVDDAPTASANASSMTHAWLITGPPGSGRSNLAYAFAAALMSPDGLGDEQTIRQVNARTHPDLGVLATENVSFKIEDVRRFATSSYYSPSVGRYRVMVVEDADRMTERTSNVLLKALEEPPVRTVWILCAPSDADMLPTIRSRVRTVRLRIPDVAEVADLIARRDGVDDATAEQAARLAQSHIGMAHRLATDPDARRRRDDTVRTALGIRSVGGAVLAAARMIEVATDDAKAYTASRDAEERESALRSLGVEPGQAVPPALRSQLKALEDDQKRRATRSLRDGIDRILIDLLSVFRDIVMVQLGRPAAVINREFGDEIARAAAATTPARTLETMDEIAVARKRIEGNVAPALALEAMLVSAVR
ncbi:DNA polymerase III subunit delta' [Labedella gwakjiensis]|uniref:DNA polymerase III subunit delta n=1 Tax=Labedella gwakjiensis TaxID=390269 RepID=A0ABY0C9T8_9MICO|nr:DNA polymerase III subunit delta' [Labedella gwakjiensis]RUQ86817.1 DNA polymerase III subunit delta' [Labedella gwakjiensis]